MLQICFSSDFQVEKKVLALESIWIVKSGFTHEVYFSAYNLTSSEPLLPFYLIGSTMPIFISHYYSNTFGKVSKSARKNPQSSIFNWITVQKITKTSLFFYVFISPILSNLFGFLSMLLIKKWFIEIVFVYLLVGHTHEKVDGMLFAKIGRLKKTVKCETPEKFKPFVAKAFKHTPWNPHVDENLMVWD